MGPRLFSRGNALVDKAITAAMVLQWGHDFSAVEIARVFKHYGLDNCFNGATTFQPWKSLTELPTAWQDTDLLQWGHDFSAVEMIHPFLILSIQEYRFNGARLFSRGNPNAPTTPLPAAIASMGPRLFSRGNGITRAGSSRSWISCFNGATTFQPWKCTWLYRSVAQDMTLQWGHDFSAVEILQSPPRRWPGRRPASMGPRLFSRGNTWPPLSSSLMPTPLQWGHDFSAVEIPMWISAFSFTNTGFNGATTFQPWKSQMA